MQLPVVGKFTLGVGVVHDPHETRTPPRLRPLQHLKIAVGVAEGEDWTAADEAVDADWFTGAVVDELDLGLFYQLGFAICPDLEFGNTRRAHHLLRRYAIDLLRPWPHEFDAAARHDEGLEPIGAQVSE